MVYFIVFLCYLAWTAALLGLGSHLDRIFGFSDDISGDYLREEVRFAVWGFLGIAGFSVPALIVNFFLPLSQWVSLAFVILGLVLLTINLSKVFGWIKFQDAFIVGGLFLYICTVPFTPMVTYDTALYHWQAVKWMNHDPLPLGLANLHGRFGFNTIWSVFSALVDLPPRVSAGLNFISNPIVMFFFGSASLLSARNCLAGHLNLSNLFLAATAIPWVLWTPFDMNSPAHDLPVMLITFLTVYLVIYQLEIGHVSHSYLRLAVALSAFAVTVKLSSAPLLVTVGVLAIANRLVLGRFMCQDSCQNVIDTKIGKILSGFCKSAIIVSCILVPWIIRGICLSGCIAYPATVGCFTNLKWAVPIESVEIEKNSTILWGRRELGTNRQIPDLGWQWFRPWIWSILSREKALFSLIVVGILLLLIGVLKYSSVWVRDAAFVIPVAITLFGVAFWFFTAPSPRFGHGFLFSLALLLFCQGIRSVKLLDRLIVVNIERSAIPTVLSLAICIFILMLAMKWQVVTALSWSLALVLTWVLLSRLVSRPSLMFSLIFMGALLIHSQGYRDHSLIGKTLPADHWYKWNVFPNLKLRTVTTKKGVSINVPRDDNLCWDAPLPCTPYPNTKLNIEKSHSGHYKMFWFARD